jgi:hypothetical protein
MLFHKLGTSPLSAQRMSWFYAEPLFILPEVGREEIESD